MEHPLDESWGYQGDGLLRSHQPLRKPQDFMYFMDYMHREGIGVILDWVPAHFPRDTFGLSAFDGTCLYEHQDPRKGFHPHWGTLIYNYGRPEVKNFLIANALSGRTNTTPTASAWTRWHPCCIWTTETGRRNGWPIFTAEMKIWRPSNS